MITTVPLLVVIDGAVMAVSSIEAIGPIQEREVMPHGYLQHTFWVTTTSGEYQWKGDAFLDTSETTAEQRAHGEACKAAAESARATLIDAVWPRPVWVWGRS